MSDIHRLIGSIYDAGLDANRWPNVLADIGGFFHGSGVNLFVLDQVEEVVPFYTAWNIPTDGMAEYSTEVIKWDPRIKHAKQSPHLEIVYDYQHIDEAGIDRDPYYDWLGRNGDYRYYIARGFRRDDRFMPVFTVQRAKRQGHVTKKDVRLFEVVSNHVGRAVDINRRMSALDSRTHVYRQALDMLPHAFFWLNTEGRVVHMNQQAEQVVAAGTGIRVVRGKLHVSLSEETRELHREIKRALRLTQNGSEKTTREVAITRTDDQERLAVTVVPLGDSAVGFAPDQAAALVVVHGQHQVDIDTKLLARLFDLTPAEAKLTATLAQGNSLTDHARQAGISTTTARWHLKNIFAKTGAHAQAGLLALAQRACVNIAHSKPDIQTRQRQAPSQ